MADKDPEENLSLQLPSFGFGRKKPKDEPGEPEPDAETTEPVEREPEPDPEITEPVDVAPTAAVDPAPTPKPKPATARKPKPAATTPKPDVPTTPAAPAPVAPELDPAGSEPAPAPVPMRGPVEHVDPSAQPAAGSAATQTQQLPVASAAKRGPSFPAIPALQAVLAVGAFIGILGVLLTFASLKFCELVRGTDSCGGPGLLLLLATLIVLTYVGAWLLRGFGIDDPGSTSFLAVALLAVMTMVFFLDAIYSWWMILVIPLVSMAMHALSWWVTGFVDTDDSPT